MEIKVISLDSKPKLIEKVKKVFNPLEYESIEVATGIDLRSASLENLYKSNHVGETGFTTIRDGRKWHWELNSKGTIGLSEAVRVALNKNTSKSLLMFEEDCRIQKHKKFKKEINLLRQNQSKFDVAIFGAIIHDDNNKTQNQVDFMPKGWIHLGQSRFILLHCVFYTPTARRKIAHHLSKHPLQMQLDGLYSFLGNRGQLRIILQTEDLTAIQSFHPSAIQTDFCIICDMKPKSMNPKTDVMIKVVASIIGTIALSCIMCRIGKVITTCVRA